MREPRDADQDESRRRLLARAVEALGPAMTAETATALLDACGVLSALAYERSEASGALLLCGRGHPSVDVLLEMTEPVPLRSARAARKMLELSRGGVVPLSDAAAIWGLGRLARPYDRARRDLFEVRFASGSRWQLRHAGEVLFAGEGRRPEPPEPPLVRAAFEALARRVLREPGEASLARIWELVTAVLAAGRGSTVVVSRDAGAEARRLASQGTPIAPRALEPDVLPAATGIGGALLVDPAGVCHAIGVILDGVATARGERARGSRFNSAANYVRSRRGALAVVISDDGTVDVVAG